ncbi:MAG: DUF192 domain-containing protein [Bacteriovoracaceae bacterium]|nr:DUF192 domain-containing protein [Bacteriovoracaceae bacterium]
MKQEKPFKFAILSILSILLLQSCFEKTPTAPTENATVATSANVTNTEPKKERPQFKLPISVLKNSKGNNFKTYLAVSVSEQTLGLSELKDEEWGQDDSMFFWSEEDSDRAFWMPDTYFNLDIFFLDKDLKVVGVERNVPFHIGRENPESIPRTKTYFSRFVLELKSSSNVSKEIQVGDTLTWVTPPPWKTK